MNNQQKLEKYGLYDSRYEHDSCGVGFVCSIKGEKSNEIIWQGLEILKRLAHRGATGADPKTGDGAGILIQIPHDFFVKLFEKGEISLPRLGEYGTGLVFLPPQGKERKFCKDVFSRVIAEEGQILLGWRRVPVDDSDIGVTARETEPVIEQVFIGKKVRRKIGKIGKIGTATIFPRNTAFVEKNGSCPYFADELNFERKLYVIRKRIENIIRPSGLKEKSFFCITNLSSRTISYKGLLIPGQLENFFIDLKDESMKSALCLVHSRYSTNTFPTWDLAQPFRFLAHNGEINTLRGNINWMKAREGLLKSKLFGKALKEIFPVIVPGGSDSATIDNVFELLVLAGRSLPHAMTMLIPAAWEQNSFLSDKLKGFYKYHTCLTEPWDGPAAIAFTDGTRIGAILDRNGLRPCRYIITKKDLVVMASEVGVLDIEPSDILLSGTLEPGKIFFIDTELGRIIDDAELKENLSEKQPYNLWVKENILELDRLPAYSKRLSAIRYPL
ncbi:MAG: glutamate synthase subunit alpha, partial [Candidatus Omnitrophota bacterium]|nr:glutamate synthase subunit alpha [Candidatus Omnitrophota bacterium]